MENLLFNEIIFGLNIIQLGIIVLLGYFLIKRFPIFVSGVILCIVGLTFLGGICIFISIVLGLFGMVGSVLGLGKKTSKSRK